MHITLPTYLRLAAASMCLTIAASAIADEAEGHLAWTPPSSKQVGSTIFEQRPARTRVQVLSRLNTFALRAEDELLIAAGEAMRAGIVREVDYTEGSGQWQRLPGGWMWGMDIRCEDAAGVRLHLTDIAIPEGAEVYITGMISGNENATGPLTSGTEDSMWVRTAPGDTAQVLCFVPDGLDRSLPFRVDQVLHTYRDLFGVEIDAASRGALSCHEDRTCHSEWDEVSESIASVYYVSGGGGYVCSGTLLATILADETPYWLTANHCISSSSSAASAEFKFDWETTSCDGSTTNGNTVLAADLMETYSTSDSSLLMIRGELPMSYSGGVYFAGWTVSTISNGTASSVLHHPSGDYMRITQGTKNAGGMCASSSYEHSIQHTLGDMEGGSSGSGIFRNSDKKLFGQTWCTTTNYCDAPSQRWSSFGRLDRAYSSGGFNSHLISGSDDELEPNTDCASATDLSSNSWPDLVVKSTDEDWYRIVLGANGSMSANITFTDSNGDIDARLYRGCDDLVAFSQTNSNNESISYTNNTGQTDSFYLRIYLDGDSRNEYGLTLTADTPPAGPENDECDGALAIVDGWNDYDTAEATTSAPDEGGACSLTSDVWYAWTASCDGEATAVINGDNLFEPTMAIYASCPGTAGELLGCADTSTGSAMAFDAVSGETYHVRVGSADNTTGDGSVLLICTPVVACPADCNDSGSVDVQDVLEIIAAWGSDSGCDPTDDGVTDVLDLLEAISAWGPC